MIALALAVALTAHHHPVRLSRHISRMTYVYPLPDGAMTCPPSCACSTDKPVMATCPDEGHAGDAVAFNTPQPDPCYALDKKGVAYLPAGCPWGGVYWPIPKSAGDSDYRRGYCAGFNAAVAQTEVNAQRFTALMQAAGPEKPDPKHPGQVIYDQAKELAHLGIDLYGVLPPIPCDPKTGRTTTDADD